MTLAFTFYFFWNGGVSVTYLDLAASEALPGCRCISRGCRRWWRQAAQLGVGNHST